MNCQQAKSQIAQLADGKPSAELVAHARACAACRQALEQTLQQQAWLRREFAEASAHLLADAPAFSESRLHERLAQSPQTRVPWLATVGFAAAAVVIVVGVWHFISAPTPRQQTAKNNQPAITQTNRTVAAPLSANVAAHKPTPPVTTNLSARDIAALVQARRAAASAKRLAPHPQQATNAPAPSLPPMETVPVAPKAPALPEAISYAMAPTGVLPNATGHVVIIDPDGPEGVEPVTIELSFAGLEPNTTYSVTGKTLGGEMVVVASITTDPTGNASASIPTVKPPTAEPTAGQTKPTQAAPGGTQLADNNQTPPPSPPPSQKPTVLVSVGTNPILTPLQSDSFGLSAPNGTPILTK